MADISQIKVGTTTYNIKDTDIRTLANKYTTPVSIANGGTGTTTHDQFLTSGELHFFNINYIYNYMGINGGISGLAPGGTVTLSRNNTNVTNLYVRFLGVDVALSGAATTFAGTSLYSMLLPPQPGATQIATGIEFHGCSGIDDGSSRQITCSCTVTQVSNYNITIKVNNVCLHGNEYGVTAYVRHIYIL